MEGRVYVNAFTGVAFVVDLPTTLAAGRHYLRSSAVRRIASVSPLLNCTIAELSQGHFMLVPVSDTVLTFSLAVSVSLSPALGLCLCSLSHSHSFFLSLSLSLQSSLRLSLSISLSFYLCLSFPSFSVLSWPQPPTWFILAACASGHPGAPPRPDVHASIPSTAKNPKMPCIEIIGNLQKLWFL